MRTKWLFTLFVAALVMGTGSAMAEMKGEVNLFLGQKTFSENDLDDLEPFIDASRNMDVGSASEYGIGASFGNVDWPVMIAVDLLMAKDDDSVRADGYYYGFATEKVEVKTTELNLGVRKFWAAKEKIHPYVGGGLAYIKADVKDVAKLFSDNGVGLKQTQIDEAVLVDDNDSGIGYWVNAGVMFRLTGKLSLGLDVRYSDADADLEEPQFIDKQSTTDTFKVDTGGTHYGILFGYRW
jgi:opacity protein-like surface antigen